MGRINGLTTKLIHDTGTGLSIIGGAYFDDYLREKTRLLPTQISAAAANGQRMTVRGICKAQLTVGTKEEEIEFKVIEELGMEVIIGTDAIIN